MIVSGVEMPKCKICQTESSYVFTGKILRKYDVKYYHCSECGFLQTEEPYWLEESYCNSVNICDTGLLLRSMTNSEAVTILIALLFNKNGLFLDYAGGYGLFTRRMRDIGLNYYWQDKFTENLMARGFEVDNSMSLIELVSSFESFEHFVNPLAEIKKILTFSPNIFFTTDVLPEPIPKFNDWYYYGSNHGQHISFYANKTLKYIADKLGFYLNSHGSYHLLSEKPINKLSFNMVFKLHKLGAFYLFKKMLSSKTASDCNQLKLKY